MAQGNQGQGDGDIKVAAGPAGDDQKTPAAQQPAGATAQVGVAAMPEPGLSLEDEALMSAEQGVAPPEKYSVPKLVQEKFPDLINLIKTTESMDEDERDYWFQILPIMTEDQIAKFRGILVTEKQQLQKLDQEYENELSRLNEKHMIEWKEFESKEKRKELAVKEKTSEQEEREKEEELLKRLQNI